MQVVTLALSPPSMPRILHHRGAALLNRRPSPLSHVPRLRMKRHRDDSSELEANERKVAPPNAPPPAEATPIPPSPWLPIPATVSTPNAFHSGPFISIVPHPVSPPPVPGSSFQPLQPQPHPLTVPPPAVKPGEAEAASTVEPPAVTPSENLVFVSGDGNVEGFVLPPCIRAKYEAISIPTQLSERATREERLLSLIAQQPPLDGRVDKNLIDLILSFLDSRVRLAYSPIAVVAKTGVIDRRCSKFGGWPYTFAGEAEGLLCSCGVRCVFFLQLRAEDFPSQLRSFVPSRLRDCEAALFQFWLCPQCYEGESIPSSGCRWIDASQPSTESAMLGRWVDLQSGYEEEPPLVDGGEKRLIGWRVKADIPCHQDAAAAYGVTEMADDDFLDQLSEEVDDEWSDVVLPIEGVKLSGFPSFDVHNWQERQSEVRCPDCGLRMEQLLQLRGGRAEWTLDRDWGTSSQTCHFVLVCPTHRDTFVVEYTTGSNCR